MMTYTTLAVSGEDAVATIAIQRPKRRNALNMEALQELKTALAALEADASIKAIIITGDKTAFSSGQDIKEPEPPDYLQAFNATMRAIENFPKPVVAAISGWCIAGGLEMAMCCDQRIATPDARIGDFHVRINSIGGGGATVRLPRLIGMAAAKRLVFTGDVVDGEAALAIGLVDEVRSQEELLAAAGRLALRLVPADPRTFAAAKRSLHECILLPTEEAVKHSVVLQQDLQMRLKAEPAS